jgi:hypothetical protein
MEIYESLKMYGITDHGNDTVSCFLGYKICSNPYPNRAQLMLKLI